MTVMVITHLTVILYISCEVGSYQFFNIAAAAAYNLNSLSFKDILCTLAHVAGKHDNDTHLAENRSDSALASASFR